MGIVNRRNAVLGWLAWEGAKLILMRKARAAVPSVDRDTKRPNKSAIAAALLLVVGALFFWRAWTSGDEAAA